MDYKDHKKYKDYNFNNAADSRYNANHQSRED